MSKYKRVLLTIIFFSLVIIWYQPTTNLILEISKGGNPVVWIMSYLINIFVTTIITMLIVLAFILIFKLFYFMFMFLKTNLSINKHKKKGNKYEKQY